jgi:hypothetical protein
MRVTAPQLDRPCDSPVTYQGDKIAGFRRAVAENCAILGCHAVSSGDLLPDSVRKYYFSLRNDPEERSSPLSRGRLKPFKKFVHV